MVFKTVHHRRFRQWFHRRGSPPEAKRNVRNWPLPVRRKDTYFIQSVDNALDVLEALCEEGDEVRVSNLSKRLGMNKVSLFRYLATFENRGYVEKSEDSRKYRLGLSAYEIGQKFLSRMGLLRKAKPVVNRLARDCNEALYLVVPRGKEVLMLDMVDTTQQVKIVPLVGSRYPICETSAGQVILAYSESHRRNNVLTELAAKSVNLREIAEQGYCYERGGYGEGVASLAVPLIDAKGNVPGSLCMVGPEFRLTRKQGTEVILPKLKEAGTIISSRLGHFGNDVNKAGYR